MPTQRILYAARAYSSRHYEGNLYDILNIITPKTRVASPALPVELANAIASPPKFYIDNRALDGFMDFFKKQNCLSGCGRCDYCQRIANKVIQFDADEVDKYMAALNAFLDSLSSSKIFKVKAGVEKGLR
jgi:hypothetical protein